MRNTLSTRLLIAYEQVVLGKPWLVLALLAALTVFFALRVPDFKLDASGDSLVLETDQSLQYYRSISGRYGSDDYLIITYTLNDEIFNKDVLDDIRLLRNSLLNIDRVDSVVSILDVPLISSPPMSFEELSMGIRTLDSPDTNLDLARTELLSSPLYPNLIVSPNGKTTALQINFKREQKWQDLLNQRDTLRSKRLEGTLSDTEKDELKAVTQQFKDYSESLLQQQDRAIAEIREIMSYYDNAELHLGGVPMIIADSIQFIWHDLTTFGVGVLVFIISILFIAFRRPRWVILPLLTCTIATTITVGLVALLDWRVTVVSSNFISLLLIITLSLTVHLIVRYREVHVLNPDWTQFELVQESLRSKFLPCFYTALTTIIAFISLVVSGIRPVIDFGWIMVVGIVIAFILAFTLFPALLVLLPKRRASHRHDVTGKITRAIADFIHQYKTQTLTLFLLLFVLSLWGISRLSVENRFIDYYKDSTEIYQGMALIDQELGGTTPLDVVIDAPQSFFEAREKALAEELAMMEELGLPPLEGAEGITGSSYWVNKLQIEKIAQIHRFLDELPETGKVLSVYTAMEMLRQLNEGKPLDDLFLGILYKRLPEDMKKSLIRPYVSDDGNQIRFSIRVYESDPNLKRKALLEKINAYLTQDMGYSEEQVHLTGMVVLYNNMLQSLFRSQILTLGAVFFVILLMFLALFRSFSLAVIALVPNMLAATLVLGIMGIAGIPLDIMTITIAAISVGIAVDNAIHYIHRYRKEIQKDGDAWKTVMRSHNSIGRAIYYTTLTISLGFSILALSNFMPTIYFGLLTGFAMLMALLANLSLLPLLLVKYAKY